MFRVLQENRNLALFWGGQFVSNFGDRVHLLALGLLVVDLTGSALQTSLYFLLAVTPEVLLTLFAGTIADRVDRRVLMAGVDLLRGVLVATLPLLALAGMLQIEMIYVVVVLLSIGNAFFDTSANALLPQLVSRDKLPAANSALMAGRETTVMLGPVVGGFLIGLVGLIHSLWVNALSFVVSAGALSMLKTPSQDRLFAETTHNQSFRDDFLIGLRYALHQPVIRAISFRSFGVNLALGTIAILVFHFHHNVGLNERQIGFGLGVGGAFAVVGAVAGSRLGNIIGQGRAIGIFTILEASGLVVFALSPTFLGLAVGNALVSAGVTGSNVNSAALRQAITPSELLGRTWAFQRTISAASFPAGYVAAGAGAELVGAPLVFLGAALIVAVFGTYGWRSSLRGASITTSPSPQHHVSTR